ncbi:hypothetical protein DCAR_0208054 [Daucus carota subsp. sativus]|uniref:WRKY domain-containing protein n=1 Tax=Daucus carota subsp. sativus TaxID=79200 RepID=A0AAF0WFR4_DAUCS|nr:hypothetical protein DCAR_0208054 [Daucus carota subsp. sativus]
MASNQEICSNTKGETNLSLEASKNRPGELAEMDQVREENGRLKLVLSNIMKDYKTLQQQIDNITRTDHHQQQEEDNRSCDDKDAADSSQEEDDHDELVSLSLGRSSSLEAKNKDLAVHKVIKKDEDGDDDMERGLALRLDGRSYDFSGDDEIASGVSRNQSSREVEGDGASDQTTRYPRKDSKTMSTSGDDENVLQQSPAKKARVSVRAICSGPTMNDGCQWRKYGQKKAKGNPCPRAYYRCTMSPSCPVRKHVQRCHENMSVLITTYEGTHNHQLPPAATAMASTTSAAVSMLKASSSTSTSQPSFSFPSTTSTTINNTPPFYFPNTTLSTLQSHPTITLDLTTPSASSRYNNYSSTFFPTPQPIAYSPPACLNFSAPSLSSSPSFEHWRNHNVQSSPSTFSTTQLPLPSKTPFYQPYSYSIPNKNTSDQTQHQPQFSTEKIAAATKEITSNPSFQSALAAAISSIVGRGTGGFAGSMESHSGAASASSLLNAISTAESSISEQGEKNLRFELSPLASSKGPLAGFTHQGEHNK